MRGTRHVVKRSIVGFGAKYETRKVLVGGSRCCGNPNLIDGDFGVETGTFEIDWEVDYVEGYSGMNR